MLISVPYGVRALPSNLGNGVSPERLHIRVGRGDFDPFSERRRLSPRQHLVALVEVTPESAIEMLCRRSNQADQLAGTVCEFGKPERSNFVTEPLGQPRQKVGSVSP